MEYNFTVETFEVKKEESEILFPSPNFNESSTQQEQIFNNNDEEIVKEILDDESDNDEIIKEMLDYELNEVNDDVEKIVLKDVIIILNPQDVVVKKKRNYTDAHRRAQQRYREKYPEKYRELQRNVYNNLKQNDEWKKQYNEKARETQKKYRDKKREEKIANGEEVKGRGRPRKLVCEPNLIINDEERTGEQEVKKNPDGEIDL